MRFKNKKEYEELRADMMNQVNSLINQGKIDDANTMMEDIKALDAEYEAWSTAQANAAALSGPVAPSVSLAGKINFGAASNAEDMTDTQEYRIAFRNYVLNGTPIPTELKNAAGATTTTDAGAVIPQTVLNRIIEKMEAIGMILPLVSRTAYAGGLSIPVSTVKPEAKWVAEGAGATAVKMGVAKSGMITFGFHKLQCRVAVTLETSVMALSAFETMLVNNVSKAMVKAQEQAIVAGDGSGKPKGILTETPNTGQTITVKKTEKLKYEHLIAVEAALPLAYEDGAVWTMTKKTFMEFVGMVDTNGQPIARVNYGINGRPERTLLGRTVILNDYMKSINDTLEKKEVVAFLFNYDDYILNSNMAITLKTYEDNDTDDKVTKATTLVDGKVVDKGSLVVLEKDIA